MQDSEQKDISDPSYSAADFRVQLAGGRLRWFSTVGLFICLLTQGEKAALDFPFHIEGRPALWTVGVAFVVWAAIAVVNWKSWFRRRRDAN
jgi:hypothetical protein